MKKTLYANISALITILKSSEGSHKKMKIFLVMPNLMSIKLRTFFFIWLRVISLPNQQWSLHGWSLEIHIRHQPEKFLRGFATCAQDAGALWIIDFLAAYCCCETFLQQIPKGWDPVTCKARSLTMKPLSELWLRLVCDIVRHPSN